MRVILAHAGLQHATRLAEQLDRHGILDTYWTGAAMREGSWTERLGSIVRPGSTAVRRVGGSVRQRLRGGPWLDLAFAALRRLGLDYQRAMQLRNGAFQRTISGRALRRAEAVIGFDTASWILARRCHDIGVPFFLDQSIAHPLARERAFEALAARFPGWAETWVPRRPDVLAAENEEHALADRIVVASAFTKRTLVGHGVDAAKVRVNPYGVDLARFRVLGRWAMDRPLRFVFVGSLQARKGIPALIEAWRRLSPRGGELWLVGPVAPQVRRLIPELPGLSVRGPVPNAELPQLFAECDVFVFPSLFEGFGLVILEAMACGLPVITTEATAGPDVMTDGQEGFLVPAGDVDALESKMRRCLENRDRMPEMGRAARATAERFTWDAYGDRWVGILSEVLGCVG